MNKKAIAILGAIFLLIIAVLGFLIYQKYSTKTTAAPAAKTATTTAISQTPATITPTVAPSGPGSLTQLTTSPVVSPTLFFNGSGITYFSPNGNLYQAGLIGATGSPLQLASSTNLSITQKSGITKILWPPAGNNFMAEVNTGTGTVFSYFNSQTGVYTDLAPQITALDFLPSGDQIMYIWLQNGQATLNISNPDSSNWKKVSDMWETDDQISISPDGSNILYYETQNASSTNPIYLTTPDGKTWKTLVPTGYNLGVLWSPDGQKFLFGQKNSSTGNYQLWLYNMLTGSAAPLNISSSADRAVWGPDSSTVYAAVPGNSGSDTFVKINIATLTPTNYSGFTQTVNAQDLFLSQDGTKLFFWNQADGNLYYLDVSQ